MDVPTNTFASQHLHVINDNIVKLAQATGERLLSMDRKLDAVLAHQNKPKKKPNKPERQRDAISSKIHDCIVGKALSSNSSIKEVRNALAIVLLEGTGMRCNESRTLTIKQLKEFATHQFANVFQTKTNSFREIVISKRNADILKQAISLYEDLAIRKFRVTLNKVESTPLWYNFKTESALHPKSVLRTINKTLKDIVNEVFDPTGGEIKHDDFQAPNLKSHSCRVTFVTNLFRKDVEAHKIKSMVGHKSIDTTLKYSRYKLNATDKIALLD
jgi:site-specific recombinase XerD